MTLFDYLREQFGANEPILINDIEFENYSRPWLFKELKKLIESGKVIRYEMGVYYIPTDTILGKSILDPRKVIEIKYLSSGGDVYGYYAGTALRNGVGLTTQMANVLEIVSNNESAKVRDVYVGKQMIRTRKPRTKVTPTNVRNLQFLELMNTIKRTDFDEDEKQRLREYIRSNKITMQGVVEYAPLFPAKAMKNIVESGVIYELA